MCELICYPARIRPDQQASRLIDDAELDERQLLNVFETELKMSTSVVTAEAS